MKKIIKNIPNDILYGIFVVLLYTFLLYTIKNVHPYFSYLFLFAASVLSVIIFRPILYLTPIYYTLARFILLFFGCRGMSWPGWTTLTLTYISPDLPQNPFFKHSFSQPFIISALQNRISYLTKAFTHFRIIPPLPQILIIVLSVLPFLFLKRETKSLIDEPRFRKIVFLFLFGALIAIPSDYLLMFLILKGIASVYILPVTLFAFSIVPSLLLMNKFFPDIRDARIIFVPIASIFFFYLIATGGTVLLLPLLLFEGLFNMFVIAFPYFEMPLLVSGIIAYVYIWKIPKNTSN